MSVVDVELVCDVGAFVMNSRVLANVSGVHDAINGGEVLCDAL